MSLADYQEGSWKSASGQSVYYRLWKVEKAKTLLVIIHGFAEHGGRYASVAQTLAEQGFSIAIADLPGHGKSSGSRGNITDVPASVKLFEQLTQERFLPLTGQKRYSLYGHSFGGMFAIRWAMNGPGELDRLIVQSPLLKLAFRIPSWKENLGLALSRLLPSFSLSMNLSSSDLSHDPVVVKAYDSDPLVHNKMSAGCYRSILETRDAICAKANLVQAPTLLLCAGADKVILVDKANAWFEQLRCAKKYVLFPGAYHELHHEPVRDQVLREIAAWLA